MVGLLTLMSSWLLSPASYCLCSQDPEISAGLESLKLSVEALEKNTSIPVVQHYFAIIVFTLLTVHNLYKYHCIVKMFIVVKLYQKMSS